MEAIEHWLASHELVANLIRILLLTIFVWVTLVVLGDVYRGEIQNTPHTVRVIAHPPSKNLDTAVPDYQIQVPQSVLKPVYNELRTHVHIQLRYRPHNYAKKGVFASNTSKLAVKEVLFRESMEIRVRGMRFRKTQVVSPLLKQVEEKSGLSLTNRAKAEMEALDEGTESTAAPEALLQAPKADQENEVLPVVSVGATDLGKALAASLKELEADNAKYERLSKRKRPPEWIAKPQLAEFQLVFKFPRDPVFLLFKHPDTNVKTTAWLTVLTSAFAVVMQLLFSFGAA